MRFYDYLVEKRRSEANLRLITKIILGAESPEDPHIARHGGLAEALRHHAQDHINFVEKLKGGLS